MLLGSVLSAAQGSQQVLVQRACSSFRSGMRRREVRQSDEMLHRLQELHLRLQTTIARWLSGCRMTQQLTDKPDCWPQLQAVLYLDTAVALCYCEPWPCVIRMCRQIAGHLKEAGGA